MMRQTLIQGLGRISNDLIEMGTLVEIAIGRAITALKTQDMELARSVRTYQRKVDEMEKAIESTALYILVSQQPVARDLRLISVALKLITDMQRIADQAYNIAEISIQVAQSSFVYNPQQIVDMAEKSTAMVSRSLDSFVNKDIELAEAIIDADDEIDTLFVTVRTEIINLIAENKQNGEQAIDFMMIAKYLERIADHAVNIASWVIFYVTGEHRKGSGLDEAEESI
ncbi:MAG: phosphate signaling complex protein PhoU [Defluviitaleaceae bacterium]|nr:phosphate signaling complex protein PhoU [Defluviitaleaceae bacterium]